MLPDALIIQMPVTELNRSVQQHGHQFVPARLQCRIGVHIDDLDAPAKGLSQRLQGSDHVMAKMTPFATQHGEDRPFIQHAHTHSAAVRLT